MYFDRPLIQKLMPSHLLTPFNSAAAKIVSDAYTKSPLEKQAFIIYSDDLGQTKKNRKIKTCNCLSMLSIRNRSNIVSFSAKV